MKRFSHEDDYARQEHLYVFLSRRGNQWTSMEQTTDSIPLYPAFFRGTYHNSTARRMLTADIEAINHSSKYDKIIISGSRGIKLATEKEFDKFLRAEFSEIFKKLKRVRRIARKGSHDQQLDLEGKIAEAFLGGE